MEALERERSTSEDGGGEGTVLAQPPSFEEGWQSSNFEEMAQLWSLNDKEREDMLELKSILQDLDHWKAKDPFEIVRYYKEYRNVKKAADMFKRMVEWRISNNMDTFLERYGDPPPLFRYLPIFLCQGFDRDGDPIYVERTGASDPYGLVLAYGIEAIAEYTQFIRELTTTRRLGPPFCWQRDYYEPLQKRRVAQFTVIMDMDGLAPRHMRGGLLGLLKRMARISQDFYAGFGKRVIIYRAPAIFEWGWNHIVKHFFDAHIREIITITSHHDYLQVTEQFIDLEVLPECLAPGIGKGKAMPGYFEQIHLEGGMLPTGADRDAQQENMPSLVFQEDGGTNRHEASCNDNRENEVLSSALTNNNVNASVRVLLKGQWSAEDRVVTVLQERN